MKKYWIALLGILLISCVSAVSVPSPHAFYGNVSYSNGNFVENGMISVELDWFDETGCEINQGTYGLDGSCIVLTDDCTGLIHFYFEGDLMDVFFFDCGAVTELNFVVGFPIIPPYCGDGTCSEDENKHSGYHPEQYCEPNWRCGDWSFCDSGIMTRNCYDASHCSYSYNQPNEITGCEINEKVFVEEGANYAPLFVFLGLLGVVLFSILISILSRR